MKHLKLYESYTDPIIDLGLFLARELSKYTDKKVNFSNDTSIWFWSSTIYRIHLFDLIKIDYYTGDEDRYFQFAFDNNNISKISKNLSDVMEFLKDTMKKYIWSQSMIPYSQIDNLMRDIEENLDTYMESKKYNL